MSGLWRVDGEALDIRARSAGQGGDTFQVSLGARTLEVRARVAPDGSYLVTMPGGQQVVAAVSRDASHPGTRWVTVGSKTWMIREAEHGSAGEEEAGGLEAPMPGKVLSVAVSAGDVVEAGAVLLVVEAMKMEHAIRAPSTGTVTDIRAAEGDMVSPGSPLVGFEVSE